MTGENEEESYGKYLAKGTAVTFAGLIILAVCGLGIRVFLARGLSKEDYGMFFSIMALISIIQTFSGLGLNSGITRFVSKFKAKSQLSKVKSSILSSLSLILATTLLIILILGVISGWLAHNFYHTEGAILVIIILGFWLLTVNLNRALNSTFQGFQDMVYRSVVQILRLGGTFGLIVLFSHFFDLTAESAALLYVAGGIFSAVLAFGLLEKRHLYKLSGDWDFSKSILKEMLAYSIPLILSGLGWMALKWTDTLMITGLRSLTDVGNYQVARPTMRLLIYFGSALAAPLFPMISELWEKKKTETLKTSLSFLTKISMVILIPGVILFLSFPDVIIRTLYGAKYLAATTTLQILSGAALFWALANIFTSVLSGAGMSMKVLKATGTAGLINIFANFLLVPEYGASGAALATGFSIMIGAILSVYFVYDKIKFSVPAFEIAKSVLGGILILLIIHVLRGILVLPAWPKIAVILLISGFFYLGWILATGCLTRKDLSIIRQSIPLPRRIISFLKSLARS